MDRRESVPNVSLGISCKRLVVRRVRVEHFPWVGLSSVKIVWGRVISAINRRESVLSVSQGFKLWGNSASNARRAPFPMDSTSVIVVICCAITVTKPLLLVWPVRKAWNCKKEEVSPVGLAPTTPTLPKECLACLVTRTAKCAIRVMGLACSVWWVRNPRLRLAGLVPS